MREMKYAALMVGLSLALAPGARAAGEMILGDSIGAGVRDASGNGGPAKRNLHIVNDKEIIAQIQNVPAGARAFLFLGTNDAKDGLRGIEPSIDNIVRAAQDRGVKLVWIGPSCVNKTWDQKIAQLDAILAARLAPTSVQYVSMRAEKPKLCPGSLTRDGVHLTPAGYKQIWGMAFAAAETGRAVAGTVAPVGPQAAIAPAPDATQPATPPQSGATQQGAPPVVQAAPPAQPPAPPVVQAAPPAQPPAPPVVQAAPPAQPPAPPVVQDAPPAQPPAPPVVQAAPPAQPAAPAPPQAGSNSRPRTAVRSGTPQSTTARPPGEPSRVVGREPIRIVVTPFVRSRGGSIRIALGLGPDPYLEPPFPLRRR